MEFRWIVALVLWTLLIGPVLQFPGARSKGLQSNASAAKSAANHQARR
jgi:hypothetical protein